MNKKLWLVTIWILGTIGFTIFVFNSVENCRQASTMDKGVCDFAYAVGFLFWVLGTAAWMAVSSMFLLSKDQPKSEYWRKLIALILILLFILFASTTLF